MDILRFPLTRITCCFVPGIVVAYYFHLSIILSTTLLAIGFVVLSACFLLAGKHPRQKLYFGIVACLISFAAGIATQTIHSTYSNNHYIHAIKNDSNLLVLDLREKLRNTPGKQRYIAMVRKINGQSTSGKILVNIRNPMIKDELAKHTSTFHIGSRLLVCGKIIKNRKPLNPGQFDYGKYLDNKSIPAQMFIDSNSYIIQPEINKDIWCYSDQFRSIIISNLKKSNFKNDELQVVNALILGQQQEISSNIMQDYQFAGAVHILSVSGLHVGFILLFANFLLGRLPKNKTGRSIKFIITLVLLWSYAIIAGLSPSVVRSVVMFSFVAWGIYLRRSTNIFHTLTVSILLILLFEPSFLFDVGFQLSYAALFFILWLQPFLSGLWSPKNKITKYFWDILTVSIAAQVGTLPISLYYFHQFPGLFFVTNLAVIPFLTVIMALGVLVLILAGLDFVPIFLSKSLEWCIHLLNDIISRIASFESFIIKDIAYNSWMLCTSMLLIFAVFIWLKSPDSKKLIVALVCLVSFQIAVISSYWCSESEEEFVVFNIQKETLIAERKNKNIKVYSSADKEYKPLLSYSVETFSKTEKKQALKNALYFNNNKILILDSVAVYPKQSCPDLLLLIQSPKINLDRLIKSIHPKMIVADASNYKTYVETWKETCAKQKIPFHYTNEKGFFRLKK